MESQISTWLIGRRDVAILPWVCAAVAAVGLLASLAWRGSWTHGATLVAFGAVALLGLSLCSIATHATPLGPYLARQQWPYILGSNGIGLALASAVYADPSLAPILLAANLVVALYIGMVLPPRLARPSLGLLFAATVAVVIAVPVPLAEGLLYAAIPVIGGALGLIAGRSHYLIAKRAAALSVSDALTGSLNRRGITARLAWLLQRPDRTFPVSLLAIDLDQFKAVNDTYGHAAGDELLAWVGAELAVMLPGHAEYGRMGGDEFIVALPRTSGAEASTIAHALRTRLAERIGCSIGVATSSDPGITEDDLFRVADTALYACKHDRSIGVQSLTATAVAGPTGHATRGWTLREAPLGVAAVRRAREHVVSAPGHGPITGWLVSRGYLVVAIAGAAYVGQELLDPSPGAAAQLIRIAGIPWVLGVLAVASWAARRPTLTPAEYRFSYWVSLLSIAAGVATAMLAGGGLTAPIGAALIVKVQFDAAAIPNPLPRRTAAVVVTTWLLVAALGSSGELWPLPFQFALLGAGYAIGRVAFRAYEDVSAQLLTLAHTDALTSALNRRGFQEQAEAVFAGPDGGGRGGALLAIDLDRFKEVNDTRGHAAGDEVLRQVVLITTATLDSEAIVGRIGGDEFAVLLPGATEFDARRAASELTTALRPVIGASIGHAVFADQQLSLEELLRRADRRSYSVKRSKRSDAEPTWHQAPQSLPDARGRADAGPAGTGG